MSEKRRDNRGRILHNGEFQMSDGRYRFKYIDSFGKERVVYSWRLYHNDSVTREAITREEERKFLKFVKEDPHFSRYYEGIYILFKTGMRISEFTGLTLSDLDMEKRTINIDHQLQKTGTKVYIDTTKTYAGKRVLPMTDDYSG